jgi:hypothetical protein
LRVLGSPIRECRKLLCYDRKDLMSKDEEVYKNNLEAFAMFHGFDLLVVHNYGLQKIMIDMVEKISTPYMMFLEHDWQFQDSFIDIYRLIRLFDHYKQINYVRFNKRENGISNYDFIMEKETLFSDMDLIRTVSHSNNPFIVRIDKFRREWLPVCINDPFFKKLDLRAMPIGIEEPLFKLHMQDVRRMGFAQAHKSWGSYVYGKIGDPARVLHLGE